MRPSCECGQPAMARIEQYDENDPLTPTQFHCEECTVRMVRVANAQGLRLDVQMHAPKTTQPARPYESPSADVIGKIQGGVYPTAAEIDANRGAPRNPADPISKYPTAEEIEMAEKRTDGEAIVEGEPKRDRKSKA